MSLWRTQHDRHSTRSTPIAQVDITSCSPHSAPRLPLSSQPPLLYIHALARLDAVIMCHMDNEFVVVIAASGLRAPRLPSSSLFPWPCLYAFECCPSPSNSRHFIVISSIILYLIRIFASVSPPPTVFLGISLLYGLFSAC